MAMRAENPAGQAEREGSVGGQVDLAGRTTARSPGFTPDDEVLREIRHSLGNHFHKLYYWADYVQELGGDSAEDAAVQPLTGTIQRLEEFLGLAMEYLQPLSLETSSMELADVASAATQVVGTELGCSVELDLDEELGGRSVALDPGRFSAVLQKVGRALAGQGAGGMLGTRLEVRERGELRAAEFVVAAPVALGGRAEGEIETLEWANAQRTMAAHGGSLSTCRNEQGTASVTVVLPFCA